MCASSFPQNRAQFPTLDIVVNGYKAKALVDVSCQKNLWLSKLRSSSERVITLNGDRSTFCKLTDSNLKVRGYEIKMEMLVTDIITGLDIILGLDVIKMLGGVTIEADGKNMEFGFEKICYIAVTEGKGAGVQSVHSVLLTDNDFEAKFDGQKMGGGI